MSHFLLCFVLKEYFKKSYKQNIVVDLEESWNTKWLELYGIYSQQHLV